MLTMACQKPVNFKGSRQAYSWRIQAVSGQYLIRKYTVTGFSTKYKLNQLIEAATRIPPPGQEGAPADPRWKRTWKGGGRVMEKPYTLRGKQYPEAETTTVIFEIELHKDDELPAAIWVKTGSEQDQQYEVFDPVLKGKTTVTQTKVDLFQDPPAWLTEQQQQRSMTTQAKSTLAMSAEAQSAPAKSTLAMSAEAKPAQAKPAQAQQEPESNSSEMSRVPQPNATDVSTGETRPTTATSDAEAESSDGDSDSGDSSSSSDSREPREEAGVSPTTPAKPQLAGKRGTADRSPLEQVTTKKLAAASTYAGKVDPAAEEAAQAALVQPKNVVWIGDSHAKWFAKAADNKRLANTDRAVGGLNADQMVHKLSCPKLVNGSCECTEAQVNNNTNDKERHYHKGICSNADVVVSIGSNDLQKYAKDYDQDPEQGGAALFRRISTVMRLLRERLEEPHSLRLVEIPAKRPDSKAYEQTERLRQKTNQMLDEQFELELIKLSPPMIDHYKKGDVTHLSPEGQQTENVLHQVYKT
jgi:hypothetical protein